MAERVHDELGMGGAWYVMADCHRAKGPGKKKPNVLIAWFAWIENTDCPSWRKTPGDSRRSGRSWQHPTEGTTPHD